MNNAVLSAIMDRTPAMRAHFAQMEKYIKCPLPLLGKGDGEKGLLIINNYRLAIFVASRYRGNGLDMEDLIGYAYIGLVLAADHYDPTSGTDFAPYACRWIQGEVCNGLNEAGHPIRLPKYTRASVTCIREAQKQFYLQNGRDPMPEELADTLALPVNQVTELLLATARFDSLDTPIGEGEDSYTLADTVADNYDAYTEDEESNKQLVRDILDGKIPLPLGGKGARRAGKGLSPRERAIIEGIHFQGKDFRQLSRELGLTATRLRQIYRSICPF